MREYRLFEHLFPQAEKSLVEDESGDGSYTNLVYAALNNTDKRIRAGKPVTPAFLFAVMLWKQVRDGSVMYQELGNPTLQSVHLAATDAFAEQIKCISVPRRFSNMTREIWTMQGRFQFKNTRRALNFLENRRFRAAYDFMCLRASAGEILTDDCEWWTLIQEVNEQEKIAMCQAFSSPKKKGRGNRTGRRNKRD